MSKIESRPSKRKAWEYFFFVDIDGHASEKKVQDALEALSEHCTSLKYSARTPRLCRPEITIL